MSRLADVKGTTTTGFAYVLEEKRTNNYELLEYLGLVDEQPFLIPKVVRMLLGDAQAELLKNHVRDEDGIVNAEKMMHEIRDIFESKTVKK